MPLAVGPAISQMRGSMDLVLTVVAPPNAGAFSLALREIFASAGAKGTSSHKLDAGEKEKIEAALKDLEEALKSTATDKASLDAKIEALSTASQKLGEKMYAEMAAAQGAAGAEAGAAPGASAARARETGPAMAAPTLSST